MPENILNFHSFRLTSFSWGTNFPYNNPDNWIEHYILTVLRVHTFVVLKFKYKYVWNHPIRIIRCTWGLIIFQNPVHWTISYKRRITVCARNSCAHFVFHNLRTLFWFPVLLMKFCFVIPNCYSGIESISVDMKAKKITVIGNVDPVDIICKLRKCGGHAAILSVGPAKDPKEEEKKKKEAEAKKQKEEEEKKWKEEEEKRIKALEAASKFCSYRNPYPYNYPCPPQYYCVKSCEENPNSCVIL